MGQAHPIIDQQRWEIQPALERGDFFRIVITL